MPRPPRRAAVPAPVHFTDAKGKEKVRVSLRRGGYRDVLKEDWERISRRKDFNPAWRINADRGKTREGQPLAYVRFCGSSPKHVHRAIIEERFRAAGMRFPKRYEVACESHDRTNLDLANWRIRPRGENKHWVNAVMAFAPEFDFVTGFDKPASESQG